LGGGGVQRRVHGGVELAGVAVNGDGVPGSGGEEMANERKKRVEWVLAVLMRARDRARGLQCLIHVAGR
jgi:hypothetical protein